MYARILRRKSQHANHFRARIGPEAADKKGKMVGVARIELATPAMSTQCSTTELYAHAAGPLAA